MTHQDHARRSRQLADADPYTLYAAFRAPAERWLSHDDRDAAVDQAEEALAVSPAHLRGSYSLAGFRADADLLLWFVGPDADSLQTSLATFRATTLGQSLDPWWTSIGVHRDAEFNRSHAPAFMYGEAPRRYVCVYPFVRSLEWYLLPTEERRDLLAEHGRMAREYPEVRTNTTSAFALGDYEWLLAFEADDLERIVDLMRHLRGAGARQHTRHELPFVTGIRKPLREAVADIPARTTRDLIDA